MDHSSSSYGRTCSISHHKTCHVITPQRLSYLGASLVQSPADIADSASWLKHRPTQRLQQPTFHLKNHQLFSVFVQSLMSQITLDVSLGPKLHPRLWPLPCLPYSVLQVGLQDLCQGMILHLLAATNSVLQFFVPSK